MISCTYESALKATVAENLGKTVGHRLYRGLIQGPSFFSKDAVLKMLSDPLFPLDCISIFSNGKQTALDHIKVWRTVQERKIVFTPFDELVKVVCQRDTSAVIEGLDNYHPTISRISRCIDDVSPYLFSNAVLFWSKVGNETYRGHRDSQSVLVVQLEGKKRWRVFEPQGQRLLGNDRLTLEEMGVLAGDYLLEPGDVLFVAGGVPHICDTVTPESMHLAFDLCMRSLTVEQVGQKAFHIFNHTPFEGYEAKSVVQRLIDIMNSEDFHAAISSLESQHLASLKQFRQRVSLKSNK